MLIFQVKTAAKGSCFLDYMNAVQQDAEINETNDTTTSFSLNNLEFLLDSTTPNSQV